jgi:hypothetical protein
MTDDRAGAPSNEHPSGLLGTSTTMLAVLIALNQTVGVVCQFVQDTDPRFPLWYFTIDSAVLAGVAALLALLSGGRRGGWRLRLAGVIGVCLSAAVFATVIAPATETGTWFQPHDDPVVRTATVLLHGVAPVLVVVDYLARADAPSVRQSLAWSYVWPDTPRRAQFSGLADPRPRRAARLGTSASTFSPRTRVLQVRRHARPLRRHLRRRRGGAGAAAAVQLARAPVTEAATRLLVSRGSNDLPTHRAMSATRYCDELNWILNWSRCRTAPASSVSNERAKPKRIG